MLFAAVAVAVPGCQREMIRNLLELVVVLVVVAVADCSDHRIDHQCSLLVAVAVAAADYLLQRGLPYSAAAAAAVLVQEHQN